MSKLSDIDEPQTESISESGEGSGSNEDVSVPEIITPVEKRKSTDEEEEMLFEPDPEVAEKEVKRNSSHLADAEAAAVVALDTAMAEVLSAASKLALSSGEEAASSDSDGERQVDAGRKQDQRPSSVVFPVPAARAISASAPQVNLKL